MRFGLASGNCGSEGVGAHHHNQELEQSVMHILAQMNQCFDLVMQLKQLGVKGAGGPHEPIGCLLLNGPPPPTTPPSGFGAQGAESHRHCNEQVSSEEPPPPPQQFTLKAINP